MHQRSRFMSDPPINNTKPSRTTSEQTEPQTAQSAQEDEQEWEMVKPQNEDNGYIHVYRRKKGQSKASSLADQAGESSTKASAGQDGVRSDHRTKHKYNLRSQVKASETQEEGMQEGMRDSTNLKVTPRTDYKGKEKGKATVNEEMIQDEATQTSVRPLEGKENTSGTKKDEELQDWESIEYGLYDLPDDVAVLEYFNNDEQGIFSNYRVSYYDTRTVFNTLVTELKILEDQHLPSLASITSTLGRINSLPETLKAMIDMSKNLLCRFDGPLSGNETTHDFLTKISANIKHWEKVLPALQAKRDEYFDIAENMAVSTGLF